MPDIRNLALLKRFTDFFKLKTNDTLDSNAGRMLVPVVSIPVPPNIRQIIEVTLNDSDKIITVPTGKQWKILYGEVTLITTANAGNRNMTFQVLDAAGNIIYAIFAVNAQVASTTERYNLGNFGNVAEAFASIHTIPIPVNLILGGGFQFHIKDNAAIDVAGDDMLIRFIVEETDLTDE